MKTIELMVLAVAPLAGGGQSSDGMNGHSWYLVGALLSAVLLAYLIYALIKPEKF